MYCIDLETHDPCFNLAFEEILLKNRKENFFILGINDTSVVTGKHQLPHREVNTKFVFENNIPVIRRISGGGTVYHDSGNLNFSMITQSEQGKQVDFVKYTQPVIRFLSEMGVDARFEGKNDLRVGGLKISGNAEHIHRNRVLHHGTLLFDSSLDNLRNALRKDQGKYSTHAVASNPSPVMNLKEKMDNMNDITHLKSEMLKWFLSNFSGSEIYIPRDNEVTEAETLALSKYRTWEWNYAYGPEYQFTNSFTIEGKNCSCNFSVKDGIIWNCKFDGIDGIDTVGKKLIGTRHMPEDMLNVFVENRISIHHDEIFRFF